MYVLKLLITCTGIPQMLQHLLNCQLIKIKLPVHLITTSITTIPATIATAIDPITIIFDVIAATDEEIENV